MFDKLKRIAGLPVKWLSLSISCYAMAVFGVLLFSPERFHRCCSMLAYYRTEQIPVALFGAIVLVNAIVAIIVLWRRHRTFFDTLCMLYHAVALVGFAVVLTLYLMFMIPGFTEKENVQGKSVPCATEKSIDMETARQMVLAMPDVKALEPAVVENGGIGIAVHVGETPMEHCGNGQRYWEVSVYENYHDRHPRYKTFLVRTDGEEIMTRNFMD